MWHDPQQLKQFIQRPLARHRVLLSRGPIPKCGYVALVLDCCYVDICIIFSSSGSLRMRSISQFSRASGARFSETDDSPETVVGRWILPAKLKACFLDLQPICRKWFQAKILCLNQNHRFLGSHPLSRRVVAYYGLIRATDPSPPLMNSRRRLLHPRKIGLRWEFRGFPIYSAGLDSRAASLTPVAPKSADNCCFLFGFNLHLPVTGSAITFVVSRLQSSLRVDFALMLRPASWLALLSRTFTFELRQSRSP